MTTTWVICGVGRGVGKTHLAQQLCGILPRCVYAKQGHGKPASGKPPNYFRDQKTLSRFLQRCTGKHEHVVVESNALARQGRGDVIVFVGGAPPRTGVRSDAEELRSRSDVAIEASATVRQWRKALRGKLDDPRLRDAVCGAFSEQKRHLFGRDLAVRSKVWFVCGGEHVFGPGLARLLEGVDRHGTLREAARLANMSYRHAWKEIRAAEMRLGRQLILPHRGGVGGGRTELSADGRRLVDLFRRVTEEVERHADARFAHHVGGEQDE